MLTINKETAMSILVFVLLTLFLGPSIVLLVWLGVGALLNFFLGDRDDDKPLHNDAKPVCGFYWGD